MELLHSKKLASDIKGSTQKYVDVEEIRDGAIVLKNRSLRSILLVSSINFDLKSTEEQDGIIMQYQNFLNSIDFPLEIMVSSRKLNIKPYLDFLKKKESQQTNELLRLQISEYQNFIKNLTEISNIMSKFFYIIVPFSPVESKNDNLVKKFTAMFNVKRDIVEKREVFETYKSQLWQRVDHIIAGLTGTGLKITALNTEEIIELLYNSYNPSIFTNAMIRDVQNMEMNRTIT
jgi:hypothetical protein